jgi:hypothetical protein
MVAHPWFAQRKRFECGLDAGRLGPYASPRALEREAQLLDASPFLDDRIGLAEQVGWRCGAG